MDDRRGSSFYEVIGRLFAAERGGPSYRSRAALAKVLGISRQRIRVIIDDALRAGFLNGEPFEPRPQMRRV